MFKNAKIGVRLGISFGVVVLLLIIVVAFAMTEMKSLGDLTTKLFEHPLTVGNAVRNADIYIVKMHRGMKDVALLRDPGAIDKAIEKVDEFEKKAFENLGICKERFLGDKKQVDHVTTHLAEWKPIRDEVVSLMKVNKIDEAAAITKGKGARHVAELEKELSALTDFASKKADNFLENAKGIQKTSFSLTFALAISAIIITSLLTFLVTRSIARPLSLAAGVAEQVASGNLTVDIISEDRRDEVGVMVEAMGRMAENLRGQIGDIKEGINVLASSSSEISSSSAQLAAGATETATAVNETTTTVEEVRQTAQLSSDKAKYVSDTAQKAARISQTGKESTDETVRGMAHIKEQMDFVAESTVSLSEQSQAIGEIITTVNDLAEQSNLLSVNASIEAARAGEQGKGFEVVAREVRSLAEQSRQATSQVKGILNDIQKAISATVMAAEQGSKAVDAGSKKAAEAGESIKALANTIEEATQASSQIAASSHQQLVGTDQVASAMENIKQASTENMESTKQLETEAKNLSDLGQKLKKLVEKYRV